ncbi:hypothetical protein ACCS91_33300 [Rhizobium ruizarguesonis]
MYVLKDFRPRDRIRIHPATDLFMRGETHATITTVGRKFLTIKGQRSGRTFRILPEHVLEKL